MDVLSNVWTLLELLTALTKLPLVLITPNMWPNAQRPVLPMLSLTLRAPMKNGSVLFYVAVLNVTTPSRAGAIFELPTDVKANVEKCSMSRPFGFLYLCLG